MYKLNYMVENQENDLYVVQNITLGYVCISDIGLNFGPREVKDFTWEDPTLVKRSANLADALRKGILRKLSKPEYEKTLNLQYQKEKKELLREQQNRPDYERIDTGDKTVIAETFDVSKSSKKQEKLNFSGQANDSISYAYAYEIAEAQAYEKGDQLTPEEFGDIVQRDPGIVGRLLQSTKLASNNNETRHKVYFNTPPGDSGQSGVASDRMTNYRRDGRFAGSHDMQIVESNSMGIINADYVGDAGEYNIFEDKVMSEEYNLHTGAYNNEEEGWAEEIVIDED